MARRTVGIPPYVIYSELQKHFPKWEPEELIAIANLANIFRDIDVAVRQDPKYWRIIHIRNGRILTVGSKYNVQAR